MHSLSPSSAGILPSQKHVATANVQVQEDIPVTEDSTSMPTPTSSNPTPNCPKRGLRERTRQLASPGSSTGCPRTASNSKSNSKLCWKARPGNSTGRYCHEAPTPANNQHRSHPQHHQTRQPSPHQPLPELLHQSPPAHWTEELGHEVVLQEHHIAPLPCSIPPFAHP